MQLPVIDIENEPVAKRIQPSVGNAPSHPRLRVLVVEDHPDIARVMQALINKAGHDPFVAHTVAEAEASIAEHQPQIAFVDIGLPGASGYDLARSLTEAGRLTNLTLIALTGYGQQEDRRKSLEAGFADHMVKPINYDALERLLREHALSLADGRA